MLKVENVTKKYGDLVAVNNLSFEVGDGEIFGLLGLNGAGKTTTFRMILGLLDDYTGDITIDGKHIDYKISDKIGFLTEERSLLTKMAVLDQIIYYGVLKSMNEDDIKTKLDYWLKRFGISEYRDKKIKELSKGNQQKVQFISAVIHGPKLLILDEPFSGLDPINVDMFIDAINELKKKGTMIIFSSHQMNNVELFCQKLLILNKGKTILKGNLKDIKNSYDERKILIKADITKDELIKLPGVQSVIVKGDEIEVNIKDKKYAKDIFKIVSKKDNILKFEVVELSLHEIFTKEVGEGNDK